MVLDFYAPSYKVLGLSFGTHLSALGFDGLWVLVCRGQGAIFLRYFLQGCRTIYWGLNKGPEFRELPMYVYVALLCLSTHPP